MDKKLKQDIAVMSFLYAAGGIQSLCFSNPGVIKAGIFLVLLSQSYYLILMLMKVTNNYNSGSTDGMSWFFASILVLLVASICTTIIYSNIDLNDEKINKNKQFKTILKVAAFLQIMIALLQYFSLMTIFAPGSKIFIIPSVYNNQLKKASISFSYIVLAVLIWMTSEINKLKRYTIPSD